MDTIELVFSTLSRFWDGLMDMLLLPVYIIIKNIK